MKAAVIIITLLICNVAIFGQQTEIQTRVKGLHLRSMQGGKLMDYDLLSQSENKIVLIEFWETWCGPCIASMPHLKDLKNKFHDNLKVICISSDGYKKTTDFINKNSLPFDFIFDEQKQLSAIFPHSGIPHTIIVDTKGKIQAQTLPAFITDTQIRQMISGEQIDVPEKKNFNPDELGKGRSRTSLVSFELLNSELGDRSYSSTSITKDNKKRIVKGYSANEFIDTVETIKTYVSAAKNILQLYSFAYGDIPENRFIFSDDLKYINSYTPDNLYTVNFSVSNLLGDFNTILKRQLNTTLGLESEIIEKDTTVLILKKIEVNGKSVKLMDPQKGKLINNFITVDSFAISGNQID